MCVCVVCMLLVGFLYKFMFLSLLSKTEPLIRVEIILMVYKRQLSLHNPIVF